MRPDVDAVEQLPADVLQQDLPVGGAVDGILPETALPVVPVGIALTRETPSMQAVSGSLTINAGDVFQLCAESPHRRRLLITATVGYVRVCTSRQDASDGNGFRVLNNQPPVELRYAGPLWVRGTAASQEVSWWIELDQG